MDVRMPDGTIIRNVPEGVTQEDLMERMQGATQPSEGLTTGRAAQVAGGAIAPMAAAAGAGALVGGPAGALVAPAALGAADLATTLYNIAAPRIGTSQVRTPSEVIRQAITPQAWQPRTEAEQLIAAGSEGAAGALTGAGGMNVLARRAAPGVVRNVMATMGERPLVQAGAGAGAAALPTRLEQVGVEDPRALLASGVVGGLLGAKGAAGLQRGAESAIAAGQRGALGLVGQPPTTEGLKARAAASFDRATSLGVQYDPEKYEQFASTVEKSLKGYDPRFPKYGNVAAAVDVIKTLGNEPLTIESLHNARQTIGAIRGDSDRDVRRLAGILSDKLDEFVTNSDNALGANAKEASDALMSGIKDYSLMSKSAEIERLIDRAGLSEAGKAGRTAESLESQFATLARSEARMRRFTPDEQSMIRRIAKGQEGSSIANLLSMISPTRSPGMLATQALVGGYGVGHEDPYAVYGAGGMALLGAGGRAVRNVMARRAASNVAAMTRGAPTAVPFSVDPRTLAVPILAQSSNAMAR